MSEPPWKDDPHEAPDNGDMADRTLGGYLTYHQRPPAFQGPDGFPYTVSLEVEKTPDLTAPFSGYLVFPRWARNGTGIVGHVETSVLLSGTREEEVVRNLGDLTLLEVQHLLRDAILSQQRESE